VSSEQSAQHHLIFADRLAIGERINSDDQQLRLAKGCGHNWVLDSQAGDLVEEAELSEPTTGRVLRVLTTEPGIQFYSGKFLDGHDQGERRCYLWESLGIVPGNSTLP
jgi:aldose 1-epimerase